MAQIIFTNTLDVLEDFSPQPATSFVPEWYKDMASYMGGEKKPREDGQPDATVKRCMPVFDAIAHGYIITTYVDLFVSHKLQSNLNGEIETVHWYTWPSSSPIEFHPIEQAPTHPAKNGLPYPTFVNPWGIKTPPGYSTLFLPPMHHDNVFTILPGVVDTDTYTAPVNLPGVLTDVEFEGLIPAGTPIAQVVPFKRESWGMSIGGKEDFESQVKVSRKLSTKFFDSYKSQYRQVKEYK